MTFRASVLSLLALVLAGCGGINTENDGGGDLGADHAAEGGADADARDDAGGEARDDTGADADVEGAGEGDAEPDAVEPDTTEPRCGDGVPQAGEECDDGNEVDDDGCTTDCAYSCHEPADCDDGNGCTTNACSPADVGRVCVFEPRTGGTCDDDNECTTGETCNADGECGGGSNVCACSDTVTCPDDGDLCNGTLVCEDHLCVVAAGSVVVCPADVAGDCVHPACVPATGECVEERDSDGAACSDGRYCTPTDACVDGVCVGSGERCDSECTTCDEGAAACAVVSGWCLIGDGCVENGTVNPANACQYCNAAGRPRAWHSRPSGTACADALFCNGAEVCNTAGACVDSADPCVAGGCISGCNESTDRCTPAVLGTSCRAASLPCDLTELCDGASTTCPADVFAPNAVRCRPVAGACDLEEFCTGTGPACPADVFAPAAGICRTGGGVCNPSEACTGTGPACPADAFVPDGTYCEIGPAAGFCRGGACVVATAETCNHMDDDGDGTIDEGVSCTGYGGTPYCPGETGTADESCTTGGTCQTCTCTAELTWTSCGPCSTCPY
jgi:hypothetical protein